MTTVHSASDLEASAFIPKEKLRGIPSNSVVHRPKEDSSGLRIPLPIHQYNKHIGGSDANSQA